MAAQKVLGALDKLIASAYDAMGKELTTKDRKKMKKSTFCGPNRSFPVPDCQHVGTAKAYLNRSNFSKSTKQKIAACINRKAKQLGCGKGKPAKAKGDVDELMNAPIFEGTKKIVEQSLENPGMELEWEEK